MTQPSEELSEKDFINEGYSKNPFPLWLWFFLLTILIALAWGGSTWYQARLGNLLQMSPFLQVTNRQLSLFLWQHPEYMRNQSKEKNAYLPGFQYLDKVSLDLAQADQWAVAPPELLFRYHTWHRLVSQEFTQRPIPLEEFKRFLGYVEEWLPRYWPGAPKEYGELIASLPTTKLQDLSILSPAALPIEVRMAFQGWKNYFIDKEAINEVRPSVGQMEKFLTSHPHYARPYWRNLVQETAPHYLNTLSRPSRESSALIPADEMTGFLKVAVYNYLASLKEATAPQESLPASNLRLKVSPKMSP